MGAGGEIAVDGGGASAAVVDGRDDEGGAEARVSRGENSRCGGGVVLAADVAVVVEGEFEGVDEGGFGPEESDSHQD